MKKLNAKELNILLGIYTIFVGLAIILVWLILFSLDYTSLMGMEEATLVSHLVAEFLASVLAIVAGILLILRKKKGKQLFFTAMGAIIYAIVNVLGFYYLLGFIWLVIILIIALVANIFTFFLFLFNKKSLEVSEKGSQI